ncbi:MAG: hypothetical protein ABIE55_02670 [Candidatus Aenigmatarchaeota archaeon]
MFNIYFRPDEISRLKRTVTTANVRDLGNDIASIERLYESFGSKLQKNFTVGKKGIWSDNAALSKYSGTKTPKYLKCDFVRIKNNSLNPKGILMFDSKGHSACLNGEAKTVDQIIEIERNKSFIDSCINAYYSERVLKVMEKDCHFVIKEPIL